MKKAVILEEGAYDLIMHHINVLDDILRRMRETKNYYSLKYNIDHIRGLLTDEDSSMRDIKDRLEYLEEKENDQT